LDLLVIIFLQLLFFGIILTISGLANLFAILRGAKPNGAILAGALVCGLIMFPLVFSQIAGIDGKKSGGIYMQATMEKSLSSLMSALKSQEGADDKLDSNQAGFLKFYIQVTPAYLAVFCVSLSFLSYFMVSVVFHRLSPRIPKPLPFSQWVVPEPFVFGFIAGALLMIAAKFLALPDGNWEDLLGSNLLVFFGGLYMIEGFSIIVYYMQKWNVPPFLRFGLYVLMFILFGPPFCLGLLDVWMDFRKIKSPTLEKIA
jgi:uncharacterized protein YybS (DUF2232 family)